MVGSVQRPWEDEGKEWCCGNAVVEAGTRMKWNVNMRDDWVTRETKRKGVKGDLGCRAGNRHSIQGWRHQFACKRLDPVQHVSRVVPGFHVFVLIHGCICCLSLGDSLVVGYNEINLLAMDL